MPKFITIRNILILFLITFIIIQFFPLDQKSITSEPTKDVFYILEANHEVKSLIKNSCYDCHSNQTKYPWYSKVAPVSWWIVDHINEGTEHLNFSIWADYSKDKAAHKLEECFEEVAKEKMPLNSYTIIHSEADLSEAQRAKLVAWFKRSKKWVEDNSK